jgi:DNA-binding NarL/FixJ family response regulator
MLKPVIKVLIVDDHRLFRHAIASPLQADPQFDVVGTAPDGEFALQLCREKMPDVVLMDLHMPHTDGFGLLAELQQQSHPPKTIMITGDPDVAHAHKAFDLGASGYMLKDHTTEDNIALAVQVVMEDGIFVDPAIFAALIKGSVTSQAPPSPLLTDLTETENDLLRQVSLGYGNKEIAKKLDITPKTISNRLSVIYTKIGVTNRVQATHFALRTGLVSFTEVISEK